MAFSPENLKIWVNSREIHAFIQAATYPPFTKGTYLPPATIVKSTTGRNRAAAHVPLQSIVQNAISMARVIGNPPPSGVAIVVISVDATSLWKPSSTRADVWVNVWGGGKVCFEGEAMGLMVLHGWLG